MNPLADLHVSKKSTELVLSKKPMLMRELQMADVKFQQSLHQSLVWGHPFSRKSEWGCSLEKRW
ncbi:Hypothetical predicted protein, partial [Marmota monax]